MAFVSSAEKMQDVPNVTLDDLDDLLNQLSQAEIEELNGDFDPDNSLLPPSQRCRDQTEKEATGPFDKRKLTKFLEQKAKEEKDWEQNKAFVKETRGKVYTPKEAPKKEMSEEDRKIETEWDDVLLQASEEELVDLAAALGFHSMLNQSQFNDSWSGKKVSGGFSGVASTEALKILPDELPNMTDIDDSIARLERNDPELKQLNLNNIRNASIEKLVNVCEALKKTTHLKKFEMAGVAATDKVGRKLAEALEVNKSIYLVNIESNYISGDVVVEIFKAINKNQTCLELRITNQKPEVLGNKIEMQLAKLVEENNTMVRFGIAPEFRVVRLRIHDKLQANLDNLRKQRKGAEKSK